MRPSVIIAIAGLALLIGGVAAALYFVPKTQITIYVEPKVHDESLSLTISQKTSSVDLENTTIPGQRVSKSVSGNASANSTGSKLIGDKAKGEVTIYNRTSLTKTLKNQTTLTLNDLEFTLDEDVTIASESADTDYSPGKASVKITASTIGEDSNLPSGSELIIASYSKDSFVAKNNNDLSGGTSQEIRVVAEEDQENLKTKLISTLQEDAKNALTQEASDQIGIFIQEELTEILQENYSADIGDETDSLSLDLEIEAKGLKYNKQDIEDLIAQRVEETTPDGYERSNQPIEVETSSAVKESDESITLDAFIKVKLLPKIDIDQLVNAIKGKSGSDLDEILKQIPGFKKAEAILGPRWLPPRLKKLSPNPKNITIIIETI